MDHDWERIWQHFDSMQQRVMHTMTTRHQFFAEPEDERMYFYYWMTRQCNDHFTVPKPQRRQA